MKMRDWISRNGVCKTIWPDGAPEPDEDVLTALYQIRCAPCIELNGETSDGYHTFNELYHHRAILFSMLVNMFPERAWKSKLHSDGSMYDGMFIVGVNLPDGQASYHYDIDPYWEIFGCQELPNAPEWDGHTPQIAIDRIEAFSKTLRENQADELICPFCGKEIRICVHDDEGNYRGELECEYESDPWSGLSYALHHDGWGECLLCTDGRNEVMGGILFDSPDEARNALKKGGIQNANQQD